MDLETFLSETFDPKKTKGLIRYQDALSLLGEGDLIGFRFSTPWELENSSQGQIAAIKNAGVAPDTVSLRGEAKMILDALGERRKKGLATLKQMLCLYKTKHRHPITASFKEAGKWLDEVYGRTSEAARG